MILKKILSLGKKEAIAMEGINRHVTLLCDACWKFNTAAEGRNRNLMQTVIEMEREGDSIRREIISFIYRGAFLPYFRPNLCRFVEILDSVFDYLQDAAFNYLIAQLPESIETECNRVAYLNARMCEMLLIMLDALLNQADLREKKLAVRIYEKKIDDIKFSLIETVRKTPVADFWQGRVLADFIDHLTLISDGIEDASDYLEIISMSMRA